MAKRKLDIDGLNKAVKKKKKQKPKKVFEPRFDQVISTGSTLLDLAISGKRVTGGGIPGGVLCEFFGPSQVGKTSLLAELAASCQARGGEVSFDDPEARLDKAHCQTHGLDMDSYEYSKPDTVEELFQNILKWDPNKGSINLRACDSLAALSTELELEKGDKMGMKRAKEFSTGLRKTCRLIEKNNWVIAASNQIRQGDYGEVSPGGMAIPFYASIRVKLKPVRKVDKTRKVGKKTVKKIVGIQVKCTVIKTVDEPYREADIYFMYGYGIDDIRANLQFLKDMTGATTYKVGDKSYQGIDQAIAYVEKNKIVKNLRNKVIRLWEEIESKFEVERPKKKRY